jgi:hypothetical protein
MGPNSKEMVKRYVNNRSICFHRLYHGHVRGVPPLTQNLDPRDGLDHPLGRNVEGLTLSLVQVSRSLGPVVAMDIA